MADEKKAKIEAWFPWMVAGVCFALLMKSKDQESTKEKPAKSITATVKETLPSIRTAYKQAFLEAAKKIESGEIKTQEQWTKWIADNAGAKQREALDKVYTAIDELKLPADFAGKEKEIAEVNRRIGGAW